MAVRRISRTPKPASQYEEEAEPEAEERPRSVRRGRSDATEEKPTRSSRSSRNDDDDEPDDGGKGAVARGWGAHKRMKESMPSDFPSQFTIEEDEKLIRFLEDEPCATYKQHWCDWMPRGSKLSYTCPGDDCPICDEAGDNPDLKTCFNIVDFTDPEFPVVKLLVVGIKVTQLIEKLHTDEKTGPINEGYYSIGKSGDKKRTQTNIHPVKERDLEEDWNVAPLSNKDLGALIEKCWTEEAIPTSTKATLRQVAEAANA